MEETEQSIFTEIPTEKIYSERAIWIGTLLAGPLVAGYMLSENFKVFNDFEKAKKTIIYSLTITLLLFGTAFLLPDNVTAPSRIFPILLALGASYLTKHFQKENISEHLENAGKYFNGWRITAVILIALVVSFIILLGIAFLAE